MNTLIKGLAIIGGLIMAPFFIGALLSIGAPDYKNEDPKICEAGIAVFHGEHFGANSTPALCGEIRHGGYSWSHDPEATVYVYTPGVENCNVYPFHSDRPGCPSPAYSELYEFRRDNAGAWHWRYEG
jgi:hypothetical protein